MHFNQEDKTVFEMFVITRNIKEKTQEGYQRALEQYMTVSNMHLTELIEEAEYDEMNVNSLKHRRIKKHLLDYRLNLLQNYDSPYTIRTYFNKVKTFYMHNEIQLPTIPSLKLESAYETSYNDLPTKKELTQVCKENDLLISSIVLFMSSSGQAMAETLSLKISDFIEALKEFTDKENPKEILDELEPHLDIVPTFYMKRIKTGKYYYTFCSGQATREIIRYLKYKRKDFELDEQLFNISKHRLTIKFRDINDNHNWGYKGKYRKFRSHTIRKYNASNIGMQPEDIDKIQGRARTILHETYIKVNPDSLKKSYLENVKNIELNLDEEYFNKIKLGKEDLKYIYKMGENRWKIVKTIEGKNTYFGVYHNLEDVIKARDLLVKKDWDKTAIKTD